MLTSERTPSLPIVERHGGWCPPGCECKPPTPSLFEMAARRRRLRAQRGAKNEATVRASSDNDSVGGDPGGLPDDKDHPSASARQGVIPCVDDGVGGRGSISGTALQELLDGAAREKQFGNLELLKGKVLAKHTAGKRLLADACQHYVAALQMLDEAEADHAADVVTTTIWHDISVSIYLNLSLVGLLLDSFDSALRSAEKALELLESGQIEAPKRHAKALFRAAKAKIGLGKLEEAEADLVATLNISNKNKDAKQTLALLRKELSQLRSDDLDTLSFADFLVHVKPSGMYLENGGKGPLGNYVFGQTRAVVHLLVRVPISQRARNVLCNIRRTTAIVSAMLKSCDDAHGGDGENVDDNDRSSVVLASGDFTSPVNVDESSWMLDAPGLVHVELVKETAAWWSSVFIGHPEINTDKCESPPMLIADVPSGQRADFERAMFQEVRKTDDERGRDRAFEKMREENRRNAATTEATTMSNPEKKALYEHLSQMAPGVDIVMK